MSRMPMFASKNEQEGSGKAEATLERYNILFVDDETHILKAMERIFKREGYCLLTANCADEALAVLEEHTVQVIVSDHRMPGMKGDDLLRKVREKYPQTIRIMLTGESDVRTIMGAINEGAVYKFITKPWNDDDLRITIRLALEQYDLLVQNEKLREKEKFHKRKIRKLTKFVHAHRSQVGRILLERNIIQQSDLEQALEKQRNSNKILPMVLLEMKLVEERVLHDAVQEELGTKKVQLEDVSIPRSLADIIPEEICLKNMIVPLKRERNKLIVAMADPTDYTKIDDLKFISGFPIEAVLSGVDEIQRKLEVLFGKEHIMEDALSEIEMTAMVDSLEVSLDHEDEHDSIDEMLQDDEFPPAIRIVNGIIAESMRCNASDIHIEPKVEYLMVRYRIDGLLVDRLHIPLSLHSPIVSRIKVMAELDISEKRRPQDGRVTVKTPSKMLDMRISTLPTIRGEKVVLRLLDRSASIREVDEIGFSDETLQKVIRVINQPQGMVLTTGPTGSGKTSTLYSLLQSGASIAKNYTTIEDPVEYFMGMAEQVGIKDKIGLTFPIVLRALLRQDPDVVMLGEIRDFETAEVAFHAALTGHLVLSTLHTNSSIASITRLRDMGIKPYVISDGLTAVIAQRLVRGICDNCRIDDEPSPETLENLGLAGKELSFLPQRGAGCSYCSNSGYLGRRGLFEVFIIDSELRELIHRDASESELMRVARMSGMKTLFEDGIQKVANGETTFDEILRVMGPQTGPLLKCHHCGSNLEEIHPYCPYCGGVLVRRCHGCNHYLEESWRNCPQCGVMVNESVEQTGR